MGIKEKYNLELKGEINKGFLKTVSAYSNYNDGQILFGIDNNGFILGVEDAEGECLRIENMINDSIDPVPSFKIEVEEIEGSNIIRLHVVKGKDTPYYYKGKAYKRSDSKKEGLYRFGSQYVNPGNWYNPTKHLINGYLIDDVYNGLRLGHDMLK